MYSVSVYNKVHSFSILFSVIRYIFWRKQLELANQRFEMDPCLLMFFLSLVIHFQISRFHILTFHYKFSQFKKIKPVESKLSLLCLSMYFNHVELYDCVILISPSCAFIVTTFHAFYVLSFAKRLMCDCKRWVCLYLFHTLNSCAEFILQGNPLKISTIMQ